MIFLCKYLTKHKQTQGHVQENEKKKMSKNRKKEEEEWKNLRLYFHHEILLCV